MHELGVLCHVVKTVEQAVKEKNVQQIQYVTLDVGNESGYLPYFLEKLFPIAIQNNPLMNQAELRLKQVPGDKLQIRELGYK